MNKCKGYSKMWFLVLLLVAFVAGCADNAQEITVPKITDTIAPMVSFTAPAVGDTSVAVNRKIAATFDEAMDPATITTATFTLKKGTTPVSGTVAYVGTAATFTPASSLVSSALYTATITTGAKDLAGNALATDFSFTFTTGIAPDTIAPTVSVTSPTNTAVDVPFNRKVTVGFSEAMDPATINTFTFTMKVTGGADVLGTVTPAGTSATFTPTSALLVFTNYTATITTGVKDLAGNAKATIFSFTFTTATADATAPTVSVTSPTNTAVDVPINRIVTVGFSEAMDPATITASFTLKETVSGNNVPGTVASVGTSATFTPTLPLTNSIGYTATVTTGAKDVSGNALASDFVFTFTTGAAADTTKPTVTSTVPANGNTGVQINRRITATFSEEMNPLTINTASFKVTGPLATAVVGEVTYAGETAVFTPSNALAANSIYTATITTAAKDVAGNAKAANFIWSFTTGLAADTTAPKLISTGALDGATGLPVNRDCTATFSEAMNPVTLTSPATNFTVKEFVSGNAVAGVVTYLGNTATFNPNSDLLPNTKYTLTISTGAKDLSDNALVSGLIANPWSWTTGAAADIIAPTVTITSPAALATNVLIDKKINATFSEDMGLATMITANFTVKETVSLSDVPGTVAYDVANKIATFSPLTNLTPDTDYTVTVTNGAKDLAGNALVAGLVPNPWTFRTAPATVPPVPLAVNLRGVASFGIASRAGLTSTGVTVVNGDVALYPLATCTDATGNAGASQTCLTKTYVSPTGMTVNGSIYYAGDPFDNGGTANSVTNDLNIAWTEARSKVDTMGAIAADEIGGKTLTPGVYHNAALGLMAGGIATLDAENDANAIFIFKVDSSFVDSGTLLLPSKIILTKGAQARNVWFVTGLDITIGSGTTWNGNILAGRTATVLDGSTVNGRVLGGASGAGAITLTGAASPSVTTINVPE